MNDSCQSSGPSSNLEIASQARDDSVIRSQHGRYVTASPAKQSGHFCEQIASHLLMTRLSFSIGTLNNGVDSLAMTIPDSRNVILKRTAWNEESLLTAIGESNHFTSYLGFPIIRK